LIHDYDFHILRKPDYALGSILPYISPATPNSIYEGFKAVGDNSPFNSLKALKVFQNKNYFLRINFYSLKIRFIIFNFWTFKPRSFI